MIGLFALALVPPTILSAAKKPVEKKTVPKFKGIDPDLQPIYDEWVELAAQRDIKFKRKIGIGFSKIEQKQVIGRCWYRFVKRQIEIDSDFWSRASITTQHILMYHELSHCLCDRDHDYGKGKKYKEVGDGELIFTSFPYVLSAKDGYFDDWCPMSIMHPTILSDRCYFAHYQHYIDEMFDRCEPY